VSLISLFCLCSLLLDTQAPRLSTASTGSATRSRASSRRASGWKTTAISCSRLASGKQLARR
jgi:hypothetical protein